MDKLKIRYVLRDGEYYEIRCVAATEFQQRVANAAPKVIPVDELIPTIHKVFGLIDVESYETRAGYYYRPGVPSIVDVIVSEG
jgi:hypothetical protein